MPFAVVIDGKPCAGKTTQIGLVARELRERGFSVADTQTRLPENRIASGLMNFSDSVLREPGVRAHKFVLAHLTRLLTASALYLSKDGEEADIRLFEKTPFDFLYMMGSFGVGSGLVPYGVADPLAKKFRMDLMIYLRVPESVLLDRFWGRSDNRDALHKRMILHDDSRLVDALRSRVRAGRFISMDGDAERHVIAEQITERIEGALPEKRAA